MHKKLTYTEVDTINQIFRLSAEYRGKRAGVISEINKNKAVVLGLFINDANEMFPRSISIYNGLEYVGKGTLLKRVGLLSYIIDIDKDLEVGVGFMVSDIHENNSGQILTSSASLTNQETNQVGLASSQVSGIAAVVGLLESITMEKDSINIVRVDNLLGKCNGFISYGGDLVPETIFNSDFSYFEGFIGIAELDNSTNGDTTWVEKLKQEIDWDHISAIVAGYTVRSRNLSNPDSYGIIVAVVYYLVISGLSNPSLGDSITVYEAKNKIASGYIATIINNGLDMPECGVVLVNGIDNFRLESNKLNQYRFYRTDNKIVIDNDSIGL